MSEEKTIAIHSFEAVDGIEITNVSIYNISNSEGKLRAIARVVINDCFQLTNLRIYSGASGLFVSYPIEFTQSGEEFRQIFYPVKKAVREYFENVILYVYEIENERIAGVK